MVISFIATVLNEEENIIKFLESLSSQSKLPDEIIIIDGDSTDKTVEKIKTYIQSFKKKKVKLKVLVKKGNRSIGRNEAVKHATGDIIVCSDSGNILDKKWIENITKPFKLKSVDVVAGYYKGIAETIFQKCLTPYVLVMPDRIDSENFLPATRSVAFKKSIWKKVGGFDEKYSHNEDYVFSSKLKASGAKIAFAKDAIVNWAPRNSFKEAFVMFFRFAFGDIQANILRDKVIFIFLRYIFALYLIPLNFIMKSYVLVFFTGLFFLAYILWSIYKNYKYVNEKLAFLYLPLIQITSDAGVILGSTLGFVNRFRIKKIYNIVFKNKIFTLVLFFYLILLLSVLSYGIPNENRPFSYFMDEWHQSQSVRNLFKYGTPNMLGSANGSIFHFFLTGLYLIPFQLMGIVNVFAIKSSVTQLDMQRTLFQILRLNTILFGMFSVALLYYIGKKYFKLNYIVSILFVFNPAWLMLSNYYKYDIGLLFWIILCFLFLLKYVKNNYVKDFYLASIFSGLAFSVKLSAIPLFPILFFTFIFYTKKHTKKIKHFILAIVIFILTFIFFGIPDLIFGKGNIYEYLYSNLIGNNSISKIIDFKYGFFPIFFNFYLMPADLGHFLYLLFIVSILFTGFRYFKTKRIDKFYGLNFIFIFFFTLSLIPLREGANGNRILVLVPFMVITACHGIRMINENMKKNFKKFFIFAILIILFLVQILETLSWQIIKISRDPREASSSWIEKNIPKGEIIGIENVPIYQSLPDVILSEYYKKNEDKNAMVKYEYSVIDSSTKTLPNTIILANDELEFSYYKISDKKKLLKRMEKERYKKIIIFKPNFSFLKLFNNDFTYYVSGISSAPSTISIYSK